MCKWSRYACVRSLPFQMVGILAEVAIYLLPQAAVTRVYPLGSAPCAFIRQFVNKEVLESIFNRPN